MMLPFESCVVFDGVWQVPGILLRQEPDEDEEEDEEEEEDEGNGDDEDDNDVEEDDGYSE